MSFAQSGTVTYTFTGSELSGLTVPSGWTTITSTEWQDTVNVTATGTVPNSAATAALPAGTDYLFSATYSGDSNYTGSTSPTGSEPLTLSQGSTTLATASPTAATGRSAPRCAIRATIPSAPRRRLSRWTVGDVHLHRFRAVRFGGGFRLDRDHLDEWQDTVNVTAAGTVPNSASTGTLPAGTDYAFSATYSGDSNYTGSTSPANSEPLTIGGRRSRDGFSPTAAPGRRALRYATRRRLPHAYDESFAQSGTVTYTFTGSELASLTVASGWTKVTRRNGRTRLTLAPLAMCPTRPPPAPCRPEPITPSPPRTAATATTPVRRRQRTPSR